MLHVPGRSSPAAAAAAAVAAAAAGNPRRKRNSNLLLDVGASPPDAGIENLVLFAVETLELVGANPTPHQCAGQRRSCSVACCNGI